MRKSFNLTEEDIGKLLNKDMSYFFKEKNKNYLLFKPVVSVYLDWISSNKEIERKLIRLIESDFKFELKENIENQVLFYSLMPSIQKHKIEYFEMSTTDKEIVWEMFFFKKHLKQNKEVSVSDVCQAMYKNRDNCFKFPLFLMMVSMFVHKDDIQKESDIIYEKFDNCLNLLERSTAKYNEVLTIIANVKMTYDFNSIFGEDRFKNRIELFLEKTDKKTLLCRYDELKPMLNNSEDCFFNKGSDIVFNILAFNKQLKNNFVSYVIKNVYDNGFFDKKENNFLKLIHPSINVTSVYKQDKNKNLIKEYENILIEKSDDFSVCNLNKNVKEFIDFVNSLTVPEIESVCENPENLEIYFDERLMKKDLENLSIQTTNKKLKIKKF